MCMKNLIPIEIDTIGIENIHTYKHIWVYKKGQNWYQLKESNDTNWNNNNYQGITHITTTQSYSSLKWFSI